MAPDRFRGLSFWQTRVGAVNDGSSHNRRRSGSGRGGRSEPSNRVNFLLQNRYPVLQAVYFSLHLQTKLLLFNAYRVTGAIPVRKSGIVQPAIDVFGLSQDRGTLAANWASHRQPRGFPTLAGTDTGIEILGNFLPSRQDHCEPTFAKCLVPVWGPKGIRSIGS
jgi:hypothetical protein